jgi:hypothetical protein
MPTHEVVAEKGDVVCRVFSVMVEG